MSPNKAEIISNMIMSREKDYPGTGPDFKLPYSLFGGHEKLVNGLSPEALLSMLVDKYLYMEFFCVFLLKTFQFPDNLSRKVEEGDTYALFLVDLQIQDENHYQVYVDIGEEWAFELSEKLEINTEDKDFTEVWFEIREHVEMISRQNHMLEKYREKARGVFIPYARKLCERIPQLIGLYHKLPGVGPIIASELAYTISPLNWTRSRVPRYRASLNCVFALENFGRKSPRRKDPVNPFNVLYPLGLCPCCERVMTRKNRSGKTDTDVPNQRFYVFKSKPDVTASFVLPFRIEQKYGYKIHRYACHIKKPVDSKILGLTFVWIAVSISSR